MYQKNSFDVEIFLLTSIRLNNLIRLDPPAIKIYTFLSNWIIILFVFVKKNRKLLSVWIRLLPVWWQGKFYFFIQEESCLKWLVTWLLWSLPLRFGWYTLDNRFILNQMKRRSIDLKNDAHFDAVTEFVTRVFHSWTLARTHACFMLLETRKFIWTAALWLLSFILKFSRVTRPFTQFFKGVDTGYYMHFDQNY